MEIEINHQNTIFKDLIYLKMEVSNPQQIKKKSLIQLQSERYK